MGLFTKDEMSKINKSAKMSNSDLAVHRPSRMHRKGSKADIDDMSKSVQEYFSDSDAILVNTVHDLHEYVSKCIQAEYCAIDTETTGLDRIDDHVVGFSLYYPGGTECYVPNRHLVYLFNEPCKGQLTYEQCAPELQRLVDSKCKMIFANADFDIAMIWHDFKVDFCDVCYYDVILAWRVLKENEPRNGLKELYCKYVLKGDVDAKKFSDFFTPNLFPYCKPSVAKLYAANDAKITYELFRWQLPYTIKSSEKCKKHHLERLADIVWNIEFPMIRVCAKLHREGMYFDPYVADKVRVKYHSKYEDQLAELRRAVDDLVHDFDTPNNRKRPFATGQDFVPTSPRHVQYLCYNLLHLPDVTGKKSTDKSVLRDFGLAQTDMVLSVRSLSVLINTFVDKLSEVAKRSDGRVHAQFRSTGADTGRMSCIAEGELVLTDRGYKRIECVSAGDRVVCFDDETLGRHVSYVNFSKRTGVRKCVNVHYVNPATWESGCLTCTPEHLVRKRDGAWERADKLSGGDLLLSCSGSSALCVTGVSSELEEAVNVYDLSVQGYHNFVVGGANVHNSANPNMQNIPSHATDIRHMFRATPEYDETLVLSSNNLNVKYYDRVETDRGFVPAGKLKVGSMVITDEGSAVVSSVSVSGSNVALTLEV